MNYFMMTLQMINLILCVHLYFSNFLHILLNLDKRIQETQMTTSLVWGPVRLTWHVDVNVTALDLVFFGLRVVVIASVQSRVSRRRISHFEHFHKKATVVLLVSDGHIGLLVLRYGVQPGHFTLPKASQRKG